jgi:hypothetical protein
VEVSNIEQPHHSRERKVDPEPEGELGKSILVWCVSILTVAAAMAASFAMFAAESDRYVYAAQQSRALALTRPRIAPAGVRDY